MSDVAIRVTNVSKRFKLYRSLKTGPIKELLCFWRSSDFYHEFMAVRDVSFEVKRGEVVGIIGPNGAGKTTLLKMIAGLLSVDQGSIEVYGKITALLALGVGVHPEFTGRDNILYTGMLLGMAKPDVLRKMDEIVDFSELGDFIDQPFRTYSSGMRARLLFSVAMSIDPDVIIVDEALAMGDMNFVQKSQRRIRQLCESGATVLFVSHNLRHIDELCSRAIVMERGHLVLDGPTAEALDWYIDRVHAMRDGRLGEDNNSAYGVRKPLGTRQILVTEVYVTVEGRRTNTVVIGERCELHVEYEAAAALSSVQLCVELRSVKAGLTFAFVPSAIPGLSNGRMNAGKPFAIRKGTGRLTLSFSHLVLGDGEYSCDLEFYDGSPDFRFRYEDCYCYYRRIFSFQAVYRDRQHFGRGTLTEVPVDDMRVDAFSESAETSSGRARVGVTAIESGTAITAR